MIEPAASTLLPPGWQRGNQILSPIGQPAIGHLSGHGSLLAEERPNRLHSRGTVLSERKVANPTEKDSDSEDALARSRIQRSDAEMGENCTRRRERLVRLQISMVIGFCDFWEAAPRWCGMRSATRANFYL